MGTRSPPATRCPTGRPTTSSHPSSTSACRVWPTKGWWRGPIVSAKTAPGLNGPSQVVGQAPLPPRPSASGSSVAACSTCVRPSSWWRARCSRTSLHRGPNLRMGVATFGKDHGWFDPPEHPQPLRPACDKSSPPRRGGAQPSRLRSAVNNITFNNYERSIGEALFGLGGYFSSQRWTAVDELVLQPIHPPGFGWPGCCDGGHGTGQLTQVSRVHLGRASDEWAQGAQTNRCGYLPGQPWEADGYDKRRLLRLPGQLGHRADGRRAQATTTRCPSPR